MKNRIYGKILTCSLGCVEGASKHGLGEVLVVNNRTIQGVWLTCVHRSERRVSRKSVNFGKKKSSRSALGIKPVQGLALRVSWWACREIHGA